MRQVWKYPLPKSGQILTHTIPACGVYIHVALQDGVPMLWVDIGNTESGSLPRKFWCFGTGWSIPQGFRHIGTVIDAGGFVWHFYEETP